MPTCASVPRPPHRSLVLFQSQRHLLGDLLHGHAGHGATGHLDVLQHRHELGPDRGGEEREGEREGVRGRKGGREREGEIGEKGDREGERGRDRGREREWEGQRVEGRRER